MKQSSKQGKERTIFLSLCCPHDRDLLTQKAEMTLKDFERLTYLIMKLDFVAYAQELISQYNSFSTLISEQFERECGILQEYPEYFLDEHECRDFDKWVNDFINTIPIDKQTRFREKLNAGNFLLK